MARTFRFALLASLLGALSGCLRIEISTDGPIAGGSASTSIADPAFLAQYAATRGFSLGSPGSYKWLPDGSALLFLRSPPRSFVRDLYLFDAETGEERLLLSAESILKGAAEQLSDEEQARRERMRMTARGIAGYELSKDGSKILVPLSGRLYVIQLGTDGVTELESDAGFPIDPRFSPDGAKVACVRDGDLYVIDIAGGAELRLTHRENPTITHGAAEFIAQEEMGRRRGYWWSPDSRTIAYQRTDESEVETLHIMDGIRPEVPARERRYPRPGKANAKVRLGMIPAEGGETTWIDWDAGRYPYLAAVKWSEHGPLTIVVQSRRQTEVAVLGVEPETGETSTLLEERDPAWVELDPSMPRWLPGGRGFLWTTERRGDEQLEIRAVDGSLRRVTTPLDLGFRRLVSVNEAGTEAIVAASMSPTESHLYRVSLASDSEPERITEAPGSHGAVYSPDHRRKVAWSSGPEGRSAYLVGESDGSTLGNLVSMAEDPPFAPEVEVTKAKGERDYDASIVRPRNFDPALRYPVIENVYGGPSGGMVGLARNAYLLDQWIADHGFIVVRLDGRGTTRRGSEWARAFDGNLIDAPLEDHVDGLKALGRRYPELDLDRVGIYGWSFGGYFSAMAVARRPDVYHAGVAGAPVVDWMDYDTHYTERFLGLPEENPEGYRKSSVLTYADSLERPLMIIHGTTDDNVYFTHSLKLSNALFRAGKDHEFVPLSNFTHMVAEASVVERRNELIVRFFSKHLGSPVRARGR